MALRAEFRLVLFLVRVAVDLQGDASGVECRGEMPARVADEMGVAIASGQDQAAIAQSVSRPVPGLENGRLGPRMLRTRPGGPIVQEEARKLQLQAREVRLEALQSPSVDDLVEIGLDDVILLAAEA